jgi:hypothetical protein
MKLEIIGCLVGSAAAMLFSGCAADPYATTTTYRGGYYSDYDADSDFVDGRTAYVDSTYSTAGVYGTGDVYPYGYGARRLAYGYPGVRRAAGARIIADQRYSSARYRDWDRGDLGRGTWGGPARRMERRASFRR